MDIKETNMIEVMKDTPGIQHLIKNEKLTLQCTSYGCHDNVPEKATLIIQKYLSSEKLESRKIFKKWTQRLPGFACEAIGHTGELNHPSAMVLKNPSDIFTFYSFTQGWITRGSITEISFWYTTSNIFWDVLC